MPEKHGRAKARKTIGDHIMDHHMVAAAEGGRHHVVKGGRRPPIIMWSPIVFSAFGPPCFFGFGPPMFFLLLAHIVFPCTCFIGLPVKY